MLFFHRNKNQRRVAKEDSREIWQAPPARRNKTLVKGSEDDSTWKLVFMRTVFYLLAAFFLAVVIYTLVFSTFVEVTEVKVSGTKHLKSVELELEIRNALNGRYFSAIPRSSYLFVFPSSIEKRLLDRFKRIESVKVEKEFSHAVSVAISERQALLLWCSAECFIVDGSGIAYQKTALDSPEVMENDLVRISQIDGAEIREGERVTDTAIVAYLMEVNKVIAGQESVKVKSDAVIPSSVAEEVRLITEDGWQILLNTKLAPEESIKALTLLLEKEIAFEDRLKLEYVDLRVENKVFYKLKSEDASSSVR